jgi:phage-related protein
MKEFLRAHGGAERFNFESPDGDGAVQVVCQEFETSPVGFGRVRLRALFEEVLE